MFKILLNLSANRLEHGASNNNKKRTDSIYNGNQTFAWKNKKNKHLEKLFNSEVQNRIFFVSLIESLVRAEVLPNKGK